MEAVKLGSTAIGLKTKDGVILAVEKRITSTLLVCPCSLYLVCDYFSDTTISC
ncbi:proteasome subunit alpha type-5-like [Trifolium medium]|uniref:Proteasome subunit alpha type-5-like n=1 Tax=Trifolium medium TaxID=97028 RepID=A0A392S6X9_9FABA|nr:proteasome subunit alpha type-5-like [Trifolium medium]